MNKFDKKVLDLYIKTNKTKEFVNKKPSYQEVLYFAKHSSKNNLNALTEYVLESNDLDLIVDYTMYAKTLSIEDITKIVNFILNSDSAEYISRLARHVENLTEGHINLLTSAIIESKNYTEILRFYIEVKNLSETNKESIFKVILGSKNNKAIIDFIIRSSDLTDEQIRELISSIDSKSLFEYNRIMKLSRITENNKYELLLKVLDTNNIDFILEFVLNTRDLINEYEEKIFDKLALLGNTKTIIEYYCDVMTCSITYENKVVEIIKESNNPELVIFFLSRYNLLNNDNINILETIVLNSNDKKAISKYIFITNNISLAKKIFGDLMYFYIFCKDVLKMNIKIEDFEKMLSINVEDEKYINYVDANIEKIGIKKKKD